MPPGKMNRFWKKYRIVWLFVALYIFIGIGKFFIANCLGNRDGVISRPLLLVGFGILFDLCFLGILLALFWNKSISRLSIEKRKIYAFIGSIILIVFFISSNIAWLNPRPDFGEKNGNFLKLDETIPFMWQYNFDSHPEFYSAAFFPSYFKINPLRISRPVYPMIVHFLVKLTAIISRPFLILTPQACVVIGFIFLKLGLYLIGGIFLFELMQKYVGKEAALYSISLLYFHKISIWYVSHYHTIELQFISPIIVFYLFSRLSVSYTDKKNVFFSLIIGILMLAKPNYAAYMAVLGFALVHGRFREAGISFCSHLVPLLGWLAFLHLYGLKYYNHEAAVYGQGVWLYREFIHLPFVAIIKSIFHSFREFMIALIEYYFIWTFMGVFGMALWIVSNKGKIRHNLILLFLFVAASWFQVFAARKYEDYMVSDGALFLYAFSGFFLVNYVKKKWLIYSVLLLWLFFNVFQIIHFPWIHPYRQQGGKPMEKIEYSGWKNCIRLKNDSIELIATTDVGPRVIRLGFIGGQNLFKEFPGDAGKTGGENWRSYGGHRLWHAPEVSPRTYEPDNDPVPYTWNGNTLKLSPHVEKGTGIQKEIEITLDQKENHVTMVHRLINRNPWDIECAAWCLSVMAPEGRAIFPQEEFRPHSEYLLPARPLVLWHYTDMKDPRWIWGTRYIQLKQDQTAKTQQKAGMLNKKGWAAYHLKGEIFLKCYDYDPKASYPDFGCNTETYTAPNMLEVETLSPFEKIPANGGILEYTEHWFLFKTQLDEKEETIDQNLLPLVEKAKESID